jgi:hypothetical protein
MRRLAAAAALTIAIVSLLFFTPTGSVLSDTVQEVWVKNFPAIQKIEGEVTVEDPVKLSELQTLVDVIVPPVSPSETTRLVEAGTLRTAGFAHVVLSLHGQVKGSVNKAGMVGAILIPDTQTVQEAFRELGVIHFPLEVTATGVSSATPYFASSQPRHQIGFEAYRVFLYNTSDKTVTVNVYGYLTN